jgi:hypothetical protein
MVAEFAEAWLLSLSKHAFRQLTTGGAVYPISKRILLIHFVLFSFDWK